MKFVFLADEDTVSSRDYDCTLISVNQEKNPECVRCFRKARLEEDIPLYVFTQGECDELSLKPYRCEGASGDFVESRDGSFAEWLNRIAEVMRFNRIIVALGRANQVVEADTKYTFETFDEEICIGVRTENYRLVQAIEATDEATVLAEHEMPSVRFDDVKGLDETKEELSEMIDEVKNFKKYARAGRRVPRGVLFYGPPGTGKTMLAKAIAGEAEMTFIQCNATQFHSKLLGDTAKSVRKVFAKARKYAPCVLFIDEIDGIGRARGRSGSSEEYDYAQNAFLSEMDGFTHDDKRPVFVIGATNFSVHDGANGLDPAFVRRFDRRIEVKLPKAKGRLDVLIHYLQKSKIEIPPEALKSVVDRSIGKSPAELELLVASAVRFAKDRKVTEKDLEEALERITYGEKREWREEIVQKTTYHEAGHALVSWLTGGTPAYVTNISRGGHGGYVLLETDEDKFEQSKDELLDRICVAFAGRAAEKLVYGDKGVTTGARADVGQARAAARSIVDDYGMDDEYLCGDGVRSEEMKALFDRKVNEILKGQAERATALLTEHKFALEALCAKLMEENSMSGEELDEFLKGLYPSGKNEK